MKKTTVFICLGFLLLIVGGGNVFAYSDIFYHVTSTYAPGAGTGMELRTSKIVFPSSLTRTLSFNGGTITGSSYPPDPIVGLYSSIITPYYLSSGVFSYQLRNEIGTGVWSLTDQNGNPMAATVYGGNATTGEIYFQGDVMATTIDLVNGIINWATVANPTFPTALPGSETLAQLQYYVDNTILTTFRFTGSEALATWMRNPSNGITSAWLDYATNVTVVPEPAEWALMIVGLGLIGFSVYRKQYNVALPEWQNVRKS